MIELNELEWSDVIDQAAEHDKAQGHFAVTFVPPPVESLTGRENLIVGRDVRLAGWIPGVAVRVTGIGAAVFIGFPVEDNDMSDYEHMYSIDGDPNKLLKPESRKWVLCE